VIDLHTHSLFSDGELLPAELVRRAVVMGYRAVAVTDHADMSNLDFIVPRVVKACRLLSEAFPITAVGGVELTHCPPEAIAPLAEEARALGAQIVVVHGETVVEPVPPGTNRAAVRAAVDILAHPGLISEEDAAMAAERGVCLELSARRGHSLTNGHVCRTARRVGATLIVNTDAHAPSDLITRETALTVARGAGLSLQEALEVLAGAEDLVRRLVGR